MNEKKFGQKLTCKYRKNSKNNSFSKRKDLKGKKAKKTLENFSCNVKHLLAKITKVANINKFSKEKCNKVKREVKAPEKARKFSKNGKGNNIFFLHNETHGRTDSKNRKNNKFSQRNVSKKVKKGTYLAKIVKVTRICNGNVKHILAKIAIE